MMEFLATNFNLPTIIVGAIVFGGVGWATWHSHKHGGCGGCGEGGCNGSCSGCSGCHPLPLIGKNRWARVEHPIGPRPFLE